MNSGSYRLSSPRCVRAVPQHRQLGQTVTLVVLCLLFLTVPILLFLASVADNDFVRSSETRTSSSSEFVTYNVKGMVDGAMRIDDLECVDQDSENPKKFILRSTCINQGQNRARATADLVLNVMSTTDKTVQQMLDAARSTAKLFNQCGVDLGKVELNYFYDNGRYRHITSQKHFELIKGYRNGVLPNLFFVHYKKESWDRNFIGLAYNDEIINYHPASFRQYFGIDATSANRALVANTAILLTDYYNSWTINQSIRDSYLGTVMAHELFHIYGNCDCHEEDSKNFMHAGTYNTVPVITSAQCDRLIKGVQRMNRKSNSVILNADVGADL